MKKFVILSLVIVLAIFFIPWKVNLQNQNVLDEMYMRLRMRHPDRYTKADFQGFSGLRFPLWDPVTESMGDSWHVPLQYETADYLIDMWFWEDQESGRKVDLMVWPNQEAGWETRLSLSYQVDTKEIIARFTAKEEDPAQEEIHAQQTVQTLLDFLDKWISINGERSLHASGDYGSVICAETHTAMSLADYLANLR